ncbi:MAG: hypothetical protein HOO06_11000 [Bdellovibrionaceae bacterium]|jgi:hypothetical protein|nr:hypothetical protein [Pseudobdellovibrionaceae bacterium]
MYHYLSTAKKQMTNKDFAHINQQALNAVKYLKNAEYDLVKILQKVDENKVYAYYGFRSLFQYTLSALHLTESQAYSYISVARKSQQCPALDEALKKKDVSVSKLKQVIAQITPSNQIEWIDRVKTMSKRELENLVAKSNPHIRIPEQARMVAENLIHLQMPISESRFKKFQRVNELLCQKTNKVIKMQDVIEQLCDLYIEKHDPLKKAERAQMREEKKLKNLTYKNNNSLKKVAHRTKKIGDRTNSKPIKSTKMAGDTQNGILVKNIVKINYSQKKEHTNNDQKTIITRNLTSTISSTHVLEPNIKTFEQPICSRGQLNFVKTNDETLSRYTDQNLNLPSLQKNSNRNEVHLIPNNNRTAIPAKLRNKVYLRDQGCCQFQSPNGEKCDERRWLDYHHIVPVSQGGQHSLENLRLLCRGHHRSLHFVS